MTNGYHTHTHCGAIVYNSLTDCFLNMCVSI